MGAIPILLIGWPALAAVVLPCIRDRKARGAAVYGAAAGVMGMAVWAAYGLVSRFMGNTLSTMAAICVGVVVYAVLVVALKAISREDLALMPKGDKIARLLRL